MAETLVEKRVCGECGVDVRPNTAFCYNCGKSVSLEEPETNHDNEASDAWFGETLVSEPRPEEELQEPEEVSEPETPEPQVEEIGAETIAETIADAPDAETKPDAPDIDPIHHSLPVEGGLKSAAAIRKRPKTFQRREVEVVWEKHDDPPNSKFILVTLILVLFTIAVFLIAMQMK